MPHSKKHKAYGYIIINSDSEVLEGIDDIGNLHFTPQYMLDELGLQALIFEDRYRIPSKFTKKLNTTHGLLEVKLDKDGHADTDAILCGRVIGSVTAINQPKINPSTKTNEAYMSEAIWRSKE